MAIKVRQSTSGRWVFKYPGCKCCHWFQTEPAGPPTWTFNGDRERPTVQPSILTWWDEGDGNGETVRKQCHSYVTDGRIQFLADSTHALACQTVELPDWEQER